MADEGDTFAEPIFMIGSEHTKEESTTVNDDTEEIDHEILNDADAIKPDSAVIDKTANENSKSPLDNQTKKKRGKPKGKSKMIDGKRTYECDECHKLFGCWSSLCHHKKIIHRGIRPMICEQCGKRFANASILKRHSVTHTGKRIFGVNYYNQLNENAIKSNQFQFTGKRPYPCDECDKSFSVTNSLARHKMSVHRGIRSHVCKECSKCFIAASDLQRHMRIHAPEKPLACDMCSKSFSQADILERHKMTVH